MDEIRLLRRSKEYLDALVQGKDPIRGGPVPEDSVLNQERLLKCFQYISGVLQREIDQLAPPEEAAPAPQDAAEQVPEEAPRVLDIAFAAKAAANAMDLPPHQSKGWVRKALREWLERNELTVPYEREDGKTGYLPTRAGEEIGLTTAVSEAGHRFAVFTEKGLGYVTEHVQDIRNLEMSTWDPLLACLTPEWMRQAHVLDRIASGTACLNAILEQLPPDLTRLPKIRDVNFWLLKQGILEERFQNTERLLVPTESGEHLGFVPDKPEPRLRRRVKGWTPSAQQFVLDNLPGLIQDLRSGEAYQLVPVDFAVTEDIRSQLLSSRRSQVYWRQLEDWLNQVLVPETGFQLPEGLVRRYLIAGGWLEIVRQPDGRKIKRPTQTGLEIGLTMPDEQYPAEAYSLPAQAWVVDHLEDIVNSYCE